VPEVEEGAAVGSKLEKTGLQFGALSVELKERKVGLICQQRMGLCRAVEVPDLWKKDLWRG